ncbi:MAG: nucleotidyltransferase family protein [Candidatus Bathyarchaeota archaeon]|nr:nucleotidyltransferase family protein [Candidatus Bathyarchaeota archaeon]MDH5788825.1 nucleotidyltransferase family protein [Candidatus Bathyarchaeota archaeon]
MKTEIRTAVILVGGSGLRMRPLTEDMPKCMTPLKGKPLIHWTLDWLRNYGFNHIVLGVAYRKEVVINYIKENPVEMDIDFSEHTKEGETGEGFRLAISRYVDDENFLAMNGDEITNVDLERLEAVHLKYRPVATIAVSPMRSPFGILEIDGDDILGFKEKIILEHTLVSIGVYIFNHDISSYLPVKGAIEKTTFPLLAKKRLLKACRLVEGESWLTINSVKDLSVAEKEFALMRRL